MDTVASGLQTWGDAMEELEQELVSVADRLWKYTTLDEAQRIRLDALRTEQTQIERQLVDALVSIRRAEVVEELTDGQTVATRLHARISELEPAAAEQHPLQRFVPTWSGKPSSRPS
ncbi:hypothetical protein GPX89_27785 [Nocardia sp. ET3-3]|uniref:Uncharacterized protein n=1 Tax=Nocardia terrae TaxID=2675851 RepID=A0A7K1V335_9NOCA|nr:hypothetical protein [Nocardia terrae]MVU81036.1 hypothetical protein [Nocardia terrae]